MKTCAAQQVNTSSRHQCLGRRVKYTCVVSRKLTIPSLLFALRLALAHLPVTRISGRLNVVTCGSSSVRGPFVASGALASMALGHL
eukprot:1511636-Amphidinium_carterae.1